MATVKLTEKDFIPTVQKPGIVVLDFWAPWCGPCRSFGPVFEKAAGMHTDIVFAKVNTEEEMGLGAVLQIRSIPTIMAFRDGTPVFRQAGALPAPALESLVEQLRALDMDDVRARLQRKEPAVVN